MPFTFSQLNDRLKNKYSFFFAFVWLVVVWTTLVLCHKAAWLPFGDEPRLDRQIFLAKAQHLPFEQQRLATQYIDWIDSLSSETRDTKSRLQFVSIALSTHFQFAEDIDTWNEHDYWTSPLEFISKGRGDCEDFAIAAYYMLYASGFSKSRLRMAYANIYLDGRLVPHMVLLVDSGDTQWVIDNTQTNVTKLSQRSDLEILLSFTDETIYQGSGLVSVGSAPNRLSKWKAVLSKARNEGFN
jgi:predicted transglutaminase-like cysteine proteinase